jgi:NAD(P)H-flavin reductase/hemoglobin-like flavoprotein
MTLAVGSHTATGPTSRGAAPEAAAPADDIPFGQVIRQDSDELVDGRVGQGSNLRIPLIKSSFALVEPLADEALTYFCGRLFSCSPHLRGMFPAVLDSHCQRMFRSITRIVWTLDNPSALRTYLTQLSRAHRKYGVTAEHYAAMADALLATIAAFTGAAWTGQTQAAWAAVLDLATQTMINAAEQDGSGEPPWWLGEVVAHERRGHNLAVLTVQPDQALTYRAGQHLSVQCTRWPRVWRRYSIANAPRRDGLLRFHVRAIPGGWVSDALVHHTEPGAVLLLGPAEGSMIAPTRSARHTLCIAGGTGLAPIKAIVEQMIADSPSADAPGARQVIHLFAGARRENDLYDLRSLRKLAARHPLLRVTPVVSREPHFGGVCGRLPHVVARWLRRTDYDVYVAGPADLIRHTVETLTAVGIPAGRIRHDPIDAGR